MPTESIITNTGYYGKAPSQGDFVKYNLPREFIEPWDDWLQTALASSKNLLGDDWLNQYLTSPIFRFVLTPGICGMPSWMGTMMPSVDRIGRYFPMTIATKIPSGNNPITALEDFSSWLKQVEILSLRILEDNFDIRLLSNLLDELNHELLTPEDVSASIPFYNTLYNTVQDPHIAIRLSANNDKPFHTNLADLFYALSIETCFSVSLWSTAVSDTIPPSLLCTQGLPPSRCVTALFDGNWEQWGWISNEAGVMTTSSDE